MPTTVHVQGAMSHGLIPLWILFFVLISPLIIRLKKNRAEKKLKKSKHGKDISLRKVPLSVKENYVNRLVTLKKDYNDGKRDSRESYQLLSFYIREFIKEYAGIDATVRTLAEIRGMRIPKIEALIEEYYACEFSLDVTGDFDGSVRKTIDVIKNW